MESSTGSDAVGATGGKQSDSSTQNASQPQSPPSIKIRKTAFKFFGGRKSICVLPSFFGNRGRSQSKASKTGVTKSQTYDGVSRACWEDLGKSSTDVPSGDFEFCSSCDSQKTPEDHGKSQSLPRQRRGLRGLFSSIRRHRKSKNAELEKREALEMSSDLRAETVPGALSSVSDRSDKHGDSQGEELVPDVPNRTTGSECELPFAATECRGDVSLVPEKRRSKGEMDQRMRAEEEDYGKEKESETQEGLATYHQPLCAETELDRLAEQIADIPEGELPAVSCTSDNVNSMFADVSSLKSFDSLTGCGDIIADQDDVSVAESSVSAERGSRNAGKRSSCFVTYQGGGEEMATPDEVDADYLQSLWESETSNEVCYLPSDRGSDSLSLTPDQQISSILANSSSSPLGVTETALTPVDLLSPQSDRQESVPNSDEGYYDSTTPGMEEDNRERPHQERLPRDSYSGDALYELFEPDDRLLSPGLPPKDAHPFVVSALQGEKSPTNPLYVLASAALETGTMETEEERLSKIQRALLCCELQNLRGPPKDQLLFRKDCFYDDTSHAVGNSKTASEEVINQRYPQSPPRSQALKENPHSRGQMQDGPLFSPPSDSGFSPHVPEPPGLQQQPAAYTEHQSEDQSHLLPTRGCSQSQEELMVCFSQALVDFTKNNRLYCNSTESLNGSESSSPFGPSLSGLPAIVTFDVVDMENEGECEQQTELVEEEEVLASPYEPFEDDGCYLQQDAFAECDQRTFDAYEQSLLLSNSWGITSLPRHLSLGRPCPPVPAPLALNRRSRSLDTDSLEFQTSELYTSATAYESKGAALLQQRIADRSDVALPRHPYRHVVDGWRRGYGWSPGSAQHTNSPSQPEQKSQHVSQMATRPSHLPLQNNCRNRNPAGVTREDGEGEILFGGGDALYPCSYPPTGTQWKIRPVGVTLGVPHLRSDQSNNHPVEQREITVKSRKVEPDGGFSAAAAKP